MKTLLTTNTKLRKDPNGQSWRVKGLTLAPHRSSGRQVCPMATRGCAAACVLEHVGLSNYQSVKDARQRKTDLWFDDRDRFRELLWNDVATHERRCAKRGERCAVRLNVASDILWEHHFPALFASFHSVTFYDYTKRPRRRTPQNYHLTYSWSERDVADNGTTARAELQHGRNVCIVTSAAYNAQRGIYGTLPKTIAIGSQRYRTVDGDAHDIRVPELDGRSRAVLLRFKGSKARKLQAIKSGFVRRVRHTITS